MWACVHVYCFGVRSERGSGSPGTLDSWFTSFLACVSGVTSHRSYLTAGTECSESARWVSAEINIGARQAPRGEKVTDSLWG